jgi:CRP/FNR family transcriptional regulator
MSLADFPGLAALDDASRRLVEARGVRVRLAAGAKAFSSGADCPAYLWVTSGTVRVQLVAESGREIVLYRVAPGESCVLTTSNLFSHETYAADGICETDVEAIALPAPVFRELLGRSEAFRDLILADFSHRVAAILMMVDASASQAVPTRLARLLVERAAEGPLKATHYDLAVELGTAREVVSRILKDWERQGVVALGRGRVELVDGSVLTRMAAL